MLPATALVNQKEAEDVKAAAPLFFYVVALGHPYYSFASCFSIRYVAVFEKFGAISNEPLAV